MKLYFYHNVFSMYFKFEIEFNGDNKREKQGRIFDPLSDINTAKTFERCPCRRDAQQLTRFQENRNCNIRHSPEEISVAS